MSDKQIIIEFNGNLGYDNIQLLLNELNQKPAFTDLKTTIRKKVVNIFVECLENIYKYTNNDVYNLGNTLLRTSAKIEIDQDWVYIKSSNIVSTEEINIIKGKIDKINNSDKTGLMKYYEDIINNEIISEKGGAGLGFIDMALKSGNKLEYIFSKINNALTYFELIIKVNLT
jgi:hypothetical protein